MPLPRISSQPVFLQTLQPAPLQSIQLISISGTWLGKWKIRRAKRIFTSLPYISFAKK
jgi:hypothetical protein